MTNRIYLEAKQEIQYQTDPHFYQRDCSGHYKPGSVIGALTKRWAFPFPLSPLSHRTNQYI